MNQPDDKDCVSRGKKECAHESGLPEWEMPWQRRMTPTKCPGVQYNSVLGPLTKSPSARPHTRDTESVAQASCASSSSFHTVLGPAAL